MQMAAAPLLHSTWPVVYIWGLHRARMLPPSTLGAIQKEERPVYRLCLCVLLQPHRKRVAYHPRPLCVTAGDANASAWWF
jgi:hypothetical protein